MKARGTSRVHFKRHRFTIGCPTMWVTESSLHRYMGSRNNQDGYKPETRDGLIGRVPSTSEINSPPRISVGLLSHVCFISRTISTSCYFRECPRLRLCMVRIPSKFRTGPNSTRSSDDLRSAFNVTGFAAISIPRTASLQALDVPSRPGVRWSRATLPSPSPRQAGGRLRA